MNRCRGVCRSQGRVGVSWAASALVLLALACLPKNAPSTALYQLVSPTSPASGPASTDGVIVVEPYVTPGIYADEALIYRTSETQYFTYPYRQWATPLSEALALLTADVLRRAPAPIGTSSVVLDDAAPSAHGLRWRGVVRHFEEVDADQSVGVEVAIDAIIVRSRDDSVLWRGSVSASRHVPAGTMPAIVSTMSVLVDSTLTALAGEAAGSLRSSPLAVTGR
jgi:uncharacterized lipoprotein YmbA